MESSAAPDSEISPLFAAAKADDVEALRTLLADRADPCEKATPFGWTALHEAAGVGADNAVTALLAASAPVDAKSNDGETPLFLAAQQSAEAAMRLLVAAKADVNARNDEGETALHVAVQHIGGKDVGHIKALLELRADASAVDNEGQGTLTHAALHTNRSEELADLLKGAGAANSSMAGPGGPSQASQGNREIRQALHLAAKRGQTDCVTQILGLMNDDGSEASQALVSAAAGGSVEVLDCLLSARANPASQSFDDASGTTPLIAAAELGGARAVRWLITQRAEVSAVSRDGASPLMAASMRGNTEVVSLLLSAKASVGQSEINGWTALMAACQAGRAEAVKQLLDAHASLEIKNHDGVVARDLAMANGYSEIVKVLDTRARLNARRAKAVSQGGSAGTARAEAAEDQRDIDKLLRDLGEPVPKRAGNSKAKRAAMKASSPEVEPTANASSSASASQQAPAAPVGEVPPPVTPQGNQPQVKAGAKKKTNKKKGSDADGAAAARVAELRERLQDIHRRRTELDQEEEEVRQELTSLGASAGDP